MKVWRRTRFHSVSMIIDILKNFTVQQNNRELPGSGLICLKVMITDHDPSTTFCARKNYSTYIFKILSNNEDRTFCDNNQRLLACDGWFYSVVKKLNHRQKTHETMSIEVVRKTYTVNFLQILILHSNTVWRIVINIYRKN